MRFYNEKETLYLETDAFGDGLRAEPLQTRDSLQITTTLIAW